MHLQPYYKAMGFSAGDFPNAEKYYQRAITLPLHPALQDHEVYLVINTLHQILN
ncbi:DegT/DnrJ/EryC1/StrS family aminotransferase [Pseudoalteromonas sp.]|nr:DegT/DnrJ/EryC1/StrS family aminotransferase [Pseudoalteromonas sp.]